MSASVKWRHLDHLQLRAKLPLTAVVHKEVYPRDEMVVPPGTKLFPSKRHILRRRFHAFRILCGVQPSPLIFETNVCSHILLGWPATNNAGTVRDPVFLICADLS